MKQLCYSKDGEIFGDDIGNVIDEVLDNCETWQEARKAVIYQGEPIRPNIKVDWLLENLQELVEERVYDQCGEFADLFIAKTDYDLALKTHLQQWVDRLNINCYTVANIESVPISEFMSEDEFIEFFNDTTSI